MGEISFLFSAPSITDVQFSPVFCGFQYILDKIDWVQKPHKQKKPL